MKKLAALFLTVLIAAGAGAQNLDPVKWSFSSKKVGDNLYELQMTATLQDGWHLYAQVQPSDAIAQPTSFNFNKNPLVTFDGKVAEVGKMQKFKDEKLGVAANQYSHQVTFVQKVKVKGKARTNVTGRVEYQTCNDEKCLPPKTVNLTIAL
jgi:thiol:disulfide interchange protein DsbD